MKDPSPTGESAPVLDGSKWSLVAPSPTADRRLLVETANVYFILRVFILKQQIVIKSLYLESAIVY